MNHFLSHRLIFIAATLTLLAGSTRSHAQARSPFEIWYEGKVVISSGDTLKGFVKYDLQQDIVQFTDKRDVALYTAQKVLFFEIFDESISRYRRFFTLPYSTTAGYRTPVIFELLEEGKLTLLAREYLEYRRYSSPYMLGSYSQPVLDHKFFFFDEHGEIKEFSGGKNDLFEMMGTRAPQVEDFVRENRLKLDNKLDFSRTVEFYNSMFGR